MIPAYTGQHSEANTFEDQYNTNLATSSYVTLGKQRALQRLIVYNDKSQVDMLVTAANCGGQSHCGMISALSTQGVAFFALRLGIF